MKLEVSSGPLPRDACLDLLRGAGLGRIAVTDAALPLILPVQYQLHGEQILFCCGSRAGQVFEPIEQVVAFEAGGIEPSSFAGWTVQVRGVAEPHDEPPRSSFEHCVQRRGASELIFSVLDTNELSGYFYELCGDRPLA